MKHLMYKAPGPLRRHGVMVAMGEFEPEQVQGKIADGWRDTPLDADAARIAADAPKDDGADMIDKMSVAEMDDFVREYDLPVPANWFERDGNDKRMTGPEKQAYLKARQK